MMFGAPLLITGLLYFAFGNLTSDGDDFDLPVIRVQVANLDQPEAQAGGLVAGETLVEFLQNEDLNLLEVHEAADEAGARAAVDSQRADVAIIIPPDFTAAVLMPGGEADVVLYQDPTLTIGPGIVKDLVSQFIDGFSGAKISTVVVGDQLEMKGLEANAALLQNAAGQYTAWLESSNHHFEGDTSPVFNTRSPAGKGEPAGGEGETIGLIMASMMIFFVFFMGANTAESIIREDQEGTLARLFTTPTSQAVALGGKFASIFVTLAIQVIVLLFASAVLFDIRWGNSLAVTLVTLGLIVSAAGFGVLLMSFVKNTRQTGPVMGGVLTLTGMLGGLFTNGVPSMPAAFDTISLTMPHGWALCGWKLALAGGSAGEVLLPVAALLGMGIAFLTIGVLVFRKRFA
jgi:ABC-2 type transport system permease protein